MLICLRTMWSIPFFPTDGPLSLLLHFSLEEIYNKITFLSDITISNFIYLSLLSCIHSGYYFVCNFFCYWKPTLYQTHVYLQANSIWRIFFDPSALQVPLPVTGNNGQCNLTDIMLLCPPLSVEPAGNSKSVYVYILLCTFYAWSLP